MKAALPGAMARLKACRGVLVDSNVLLDVATRDPAWGEWSAQALAEAAETRCWLLDAALPSALYRREPLPWEAGFLAGKCFLQYRRHGGMRTSPLPDFYIGAHAAIAGLGLLTRDAARYRSYFPGISVFAPSKHPA